MAGYIMFLVIGLGLIPFAFWIDNVNKNSTLGKEHPEKLKKPLHKRWWIYLIAVILVVGSIGNLADPSTYKSTATKLKVHKTKKKSKAEKEFEKKMDAEGKKQDKEFNSKKSSGFKQSKHKKTTKDSGIPSNKSLRKEVQKEHLATLKKQLNSLDSDKYGGNTIDNINVMSGGHIEVTFTQNFIKESTKDERSLVQKSIVDDIGDIYNRYAPYPGNVSLGDIVFFDADGNGYGIWDTDGNKESE